MVEKSVEDQIPGFAVGVDALVWFVAIDTADRGVVAFGASGAIGGSARVVARKVGSCAGAPCRLSFGSAVGKSGTEFLALCALGHQGGWDVVGVPAFAVEQGYRADVQVSDFICDGDDDGGRGLSGACLWGG